MLAMSNNSYRRNRNNGDGGTDFWVSADGMLEDYPKKYPYRSMVCDGMVYTKSSRSSYNGSELK